MNLTGDKSFESRAKLMISGEYLVLNGALSLALPLKFGQKLMIQEVSGNPSVVWKSMIKDNSWFFTTLLLPDFRIVETNGPDLSETLCKILIEAKKLNPGFLALPCKYEAISTMDFNPDWGIGSSSSLISNIGWWADCNPFELNKLIFNGSGYDIACAKSLEPIVFETNSGQYSYRKANFNPSFRTSLYFVYLNRKQNTRESVQKTDLSEVTAATIDSVSKLTLEMEKADSLEVFQFLMDQHEKIIGEIIGKKRVSDLYFNDFNGSVKSLGAWGGDFILAASADSEEYVRKYFINKNLSTIFRYDEIVLH